MESACPDGQGVVTTAQADRKTTASTRSVRRMGRSPQAGGGLNDGPARRHLQVGLDLAAAKAAGYSKVNIALTGSRGVVSDPGWVRGWADRARRLGMGICCYHWLTGASSGAAQA